MAKPASGRGSGPKNLGRPAQRLSLAPRVWLWVGGDFKGDCNCVGSVNRSNNNYDGADKSSPLLIQQQAAPLAAGDA